MTQDDITFLEQIFIYCKKCGIHYKESIWIKPSVCPKCSNPN